MSDTETTIRPAPTGTGRRAAAAIVALLSVVILAGCLSANQTKAMDIVNASRRAHAKAAVSADSKAMAKAQAWSEHMATTGRLEHTGGGSRLDTSGLPCWRAVAENVGYGPTIQSVQDAFMRSPNHKANVLGNYNKVGTGVVRKGNVVWVTQIFFRAC